jgi:hypothetical protein
MGSRCERARAPRPRIDAPRVLVPLVPVHASRYRRVMAKSTTEAVQKVRDLVTLAQSGDNETPEARTAAVQAVRMMKEYDLVVVPQDEIRRVEQRIDGLQRALKERGNKDMILGGLLGAALVKGFKF